MRCEAARWVSADVIWRALKAGFKGTFDLVRGVLTCGWEKEVSYEYCTKFEQSISGLRWFREKLVLLRHCSMEAQQKIRSRLTTQCSIPFPSITATLSPFCTPNFSRPLANASL